jgi:hypothetical protein
MKKGMKKKLENLGDLETRVIQYSKIVMGSVALYFLWELINKIDYIVLK